MPKDTIIGLGFGNEERVRALVAERKMALQSFNHDMQKLSQVEAVFKDIYSGKQIVNHTDLALFREKYTGLVAACTAHLKKMSTNDEESCAPKLEEFKAKGEVLGRLWHTDCGPIVKPINTMLNHMLTLSSPNLIGFTEGQTLPVIDRYVERQLSKCRDQIQDILNRNRGAIGEEAVNQLKKDIIERYDHYRSKIIEKQPEMAAHLPEAQTYFVVGGEYNQISSRDTVTYEIKTNPPPAFKPPPPPPGPTPKERQQAALKAQLNQEIGRGAEGEQPLMNNTPRGSQGLRMKK